MVRDQILSQPTDVWNMRRQSSSSNNSHNCYINTSTPVPGNGIYISDDIHSPDHSKIYSSKSPRLSMTMTMTPTNRNGDHDEKFGAYNSSPGSVISCGDDSVFSPIEEGLDHQTNSLLEVINAGLSPYQQQQSRFSAFPIDLDILDETLLTSYLTEYYENLHGFSPHLRPHPAAAIFPSAMKNPALFHLILALSAQFQLYNNSALSRNQRQQLECSLMRHKGEALQIIRTFNTGSTTREQPEGILVSILGLGMLDRYSDSEETASIHFAAGRQLLKSIGGPATIQDIWLSRLMAHFECGYGPVKQSFIWDQSDFKGLHADLNKFFGQLWSLRNPPSPVSRHPYSRRGSSASCSSRSPISPRASLSPIQQHATVIGLQENTLLHECLSRQPLDPSNPTAHDQMEMYFQLTCLLLLSAVISDHQTDPFMLQSYITSIHSLVTSSYNPSDSINNVLWLLQIHDHSENHTKRVWSSVSWVRVLRHVNYGVQAMVKSWLTAVLTGKAVNRPLKLDSFAFSYAS